MATVNLAVWDRSVLFAEWRSRRRAVLVIIDGVIAGVFGFMMARLVFPKFLRLLLTGESDYG